MRKIPIHQTVVLTEGAVIRPVEQQITVPDILATIRNTFGSSDLPVEEVEGAVDAFDKIDNILQRLGIS